MAYFCSPAKGVGKYIGIDLVEVLYKTMSVLIKSRIGEGVRFQDTLRGFRDG